MSTNIQDALNAVVGTNKAAQTATDIYSQAAQSVVNQANDTLEQATQATKDLQQAQQDKGNITVQTAQTAARANATDEAVNSFAYGQQALAPDVKQAIDDYHKQLQDYHEHHGGFLNQIMLGATGKDIAAENLAAQGDALGKLQMNLGELASRASADSLLNSQLAAAANLPRQSAAQSKIDQAQSYLEHVVPAIDNAQKIKIRAATDVSDAAKQKATEAKNMYMTLITGAHEQKENQNADLQRQILSLNIDEKQMQIKQAMQDTDFKNELSVRSGVPVPLLEKQPIQTITDIANAQSGLPVVYNIGDPKEIERAKQVSTTLADPYQNSTAKYVGDETLALLQENNSVQTQLAGGQKLANIARNPNYTTVRDIRTDFLDNVKIKFPGSDSPDTLPNTLAKWFTDPLDKGSVFWKSPETQAYIQSGSAGATLAKRISDDTQANPGALKHGVTINYLAAVGGDKNSIYDFYNFLQNRVITSSPYRLYGMAPPQANIGIRMDTQSTGIFNDITPNTIYVTPKTPEDIQTALITMRANQKAAEAAAKFKSSGYVGFPGKL